MNWTRSYLPSKLYCFKGISSEEKRGREKGRERGLYYISRRWLVNIPEHVGVDNIQPAIFRLLNEGFPHLIFRINVEDPCQERMTTQNQHFIRWMSEPEKGKIREHMEYLRRASWVVNGAGEEDSLAAIDDERLPVVSDTATGEVEGQAEECAEQSPLEGSWACSCSFHGDWEWLEGYRESGLWTVQQPKNKKRNSPLLSVSTLVSCLLYMWRG